MTDDVQGLVTSISLNQVLVALLEEHTKLTVPTSKFLQVSSEEKELVIDYFIYSLSPFGFLLIEKSLKEKKLVE